MAELRILEKPKKEPKEEPNTPMTDVIAKLLSQISVSLVSLIEHKEKPLNDDDGKMKTLDLLPKKLTSCLMQQSNQKNGNLRSSEMRIRELLKL